MFLINKKNPMNLSLEQIINHKLKNNKEYREEYLREQEEERKEKEEIARLDRELLEYKNQSSNKQSSTGYFTNCLIS